MKKLLFLLLAVTVITGVYAQDASKKKPASPPMSVSKTTNSGIKIAIDYGQPSLKGRTVGKDVEPMDAKVWRAGANKTTTFEISKDATIDGAKLPAGKYGLHVLANGDSWTFIFSKKWEQWGTEYKEEEDQLRVTTNTTKPAKTAELLTYTIGDDGKVTLAWGDKQAGFTVE